MARYFIGRIRLRLFAFIALFISVAVTGQTTHWHIEAESPETRVLLRGDTLDITSPAGLSLWWADLLQVPVTVSYRACVVVDGGRYDRLSDLNSFFLASDPQQPTPMHGMGRRNGRFVESYRLQCYYLGYGGNYNSTTRFRRYSADTLGVSDVAHRPPVLVEYTDSLHLLKPNHWYDVTVTATAEGSETHVRYSIDGELIIDYLDPLGLRSGYFALRTTWSHLRVTSVWIY